MYNLYNNKDLPFVALCDRAACCWWFESLI